MQDWLRMSAGDLGRDIAAGRIDPLDLTRGFLAAIDGHPMRDRIYARVTPERALAEAGAAQERARAGRRLSLLDGVPISWKDSFDTGGIATEAGSGLLKGRVPEQDAVVLRNATAMGTICLGKTHMSELAFSGLGYNPSTATPPNITDAEAAPGGSSSGAAASVAFDLAACAVGSDTGGSVRVPAAWNDLIGLKTTSGRLDLGGVVPLCLKFDTIGPLTRTVEDAALMLAVLEGSNCPADLRGSSLKGRHLAILQTVALDDIREAPRTAFDKAVDRLADAGAVVTNVALPALDEAMELSGALYTAEAYGLWRDKIEANPDAMFPSIRDRFRQGRGTAGADYVAGWAALEAARTAWGRATAGFDAVLCPTAPNLPPNLERLRTDNEYYISENLLTLRNTRIGNLMGVTALTLPTATPGCGITLMARPFGETALLRLGAAAEQALA
ncbi:amidase [Pontibaca salina]|uniref:Amidase n=1 Tax=Pontibaca salina TaxID=2795731 RepID=A0A934M0E6_9RHOB|nr:amidase family protein [Pontibaca salina]MBI6629668.1 amidase [Pontibaca salina]